MPDWHYMSLKLIFERPTGLILGAQAIGSAPLAAGFVAAFVVGCLACKFMIEIVKRGKLVWFALYCAAAGTVSILSYVL